MDASGVRNIECGQVFTQGDRWAIVDWDLEFDVGDGGEEPDSVEVDDDEALIVVDDIGDVVDNREVDWVFEGVVEADGGGIEAGCFRISGVGRLGRRDDEREG